MAEPKKQNPGELGFVDEGPDEFLQGQRFGIQVKLPALHDVNSTFQRIQVFDTVAYGRALVLDGVVQLTEKDEFAYHEMIVHVPVSCVPANGLKVLLIGAGDGGALRELMSYDKTRLESVDHVEIDGGVLDVCKKLLPKVSNGAFDDPRLRLHVADGFAFVRETKERYHTIIVDSSDPTQGPNGPLFDITFYRNLKAIMQPQSVLCVQAENPWFHLDLIQGIAEKLGQVFQGRVRYYGTQVPSYPGSYIGFFLCWNSAELDESWSKPPAVPPKEIQDKLQYYSLDVHRAAFVLPRRIAAAVDAAIASGKAKTN